MAKVKVKGIKSTLAALRKVLDGTATKGVIAASQTIENEIIITILSGQSPVKGKKFKRYSQQYADRAKDGQRQPVDMKVTGKMLDSLSVKRGPRKNSVSISLGSKIAKFHDKLGAGTSKVIRRLLPDFSKGETFKANILTEIRKAMVKGITR